MSSLAVVPFERSHATRVIALWRSLHPDWTWLDDASAADLFEPRPNRELIRYVVERGDAAIATVFASRLKESTRTHDRIIAIEARAEDIGTDWLRTILRSLAAMDQEEPGVRQVLNAEPNLSTVLRPLLEAEAFSSSFKTLRIEWCGDFITVADPGAIRFQRYAGGSREIDAAIVELHNRSYRAARVKPPINPDDLWRPVATLQKREFVLAIDAGRVVGFGEWWLTAGEAWFTNYGVARSHWGTPIAGTLAANVMQAMLQDGHTKMAAVIRSTNAAVIRQARALGWTIAAELSHTFVREF